jgi:hypothetical protein
MVLLRSHLDVATPAGGTDVTGQVLDEAGRPVRQATVKLNEFRTQTDASGRYSFRHVPEGEYIAMLDEDNLAADYKVKSGPRTLSLGGRRSERVDFRVVQLRTIGGRVVCERSGGKAEGVGGVVIFLDDVATTTAEDGTYRFYNAEPGRHVVRLDTQRLSKAYDPPNSIVRSVELSASALLADIEFRLTAHEKPVVFQPLP